MTIQPFFSFFILLSLSLSSSSSLNSSPNSLTLLRSNSTILSPNKTFQLGFFTPNPDLSNIYLGIWYATLPTRTYIWVANRHTPLKDLSTSSLSISFDQLTLSDSFNFVVWKSNNLLPGSHLRLLDSGNLVLLSPSNDVVWQSFDSPSDTWLPGMNITAGVSLTSWKSVWDPSPGRYSLRLRPQGYGEIELVYNDTVSYWNTGNWTGSSFVNVPEMTVMYIYRFYFDKVFTKTASFGFNEVPSPTDNGPPPLTRFHVSSSGEVRQYTWSTQTENWNSFWARPESRCRVYGLCGGNGVCYGENVRACGCPDGFGPVDDLSWAAGDYSGGCRRVGGDICGGDDKFVEIGSAMSFDGAKTVSFQSSVESRSECEKGCLGNCSCVGVVYNERVNVCNGVFGVLVNLRNTIAGAGGGGGGGGVMGGDDDVLYLRVGKNGVKSKGLSHKMVILISTICGLVLMIFVMGLILWVVRKELRRKRKEEEEATLAATHLKVFSYKDLHGATRGFSEKVGHGGFGTVFRGTLSDSSLVAVKRLERPGSGGEKEFRAEVCTIGNVQHVNLVRLRGFCSENSHRLLVYDYMHNGPLSGYLKKDGQNMSWDVRFRVAIGTAKALAYLHEECRQCIIHCDIKPENILLDSDYTPKVSDFGLAKLIGRDFSRVLATMRGTWGYVAPEWISGVAITNKADVYSYGMTMLELIGGRRNVEAPPPSPSLGPNEGDGVSDPNGGGNKWFFPPWASRKIIEGNVEEVVDPRLGVAYDRVEAERVGMVGVWCIQDEEEARPSMGMVVKMLEGVVDVGVPPPPKLLQALVAGDSFEAIPSGNVASSNAAGFGSEDDTCNIRVSVETVPSYTS